MSSVSDTAILGTNVTIGRFCIVEPDVEIGDGSVLADYVLIRSGTKVGQQCYFGPHTVIGRNVEIGDGVKITAFGEIRDNCVVGDCSSFGSRCTLSAGTRVGKDVIIKYAFVATDTPRLGGTEKLTCELKDESKFGANVVVMPGMTVGKRSVVGACSQVRCDIGDDEVWFGNPAKRLR